MQMQRCGSCRRHVAAHETTCPFCRTAVGLVAASMATAVLALSIACTVGEEALDSGAPTSLAGSSDTSTTTHASTTTTDTSSSSSSSSNGSSVSSTSIGDDTTASHTDDPTAAGFIYGAPDTEGGIFIECDIWAQDCPVGDKCVPWANDGGSTWNAARCSPVVDDPQDAGEPCMVAEFELSGVDDCALGSLCWAVDDGLQGTCIEQCQGSPNDPECSGDLECFVTDESILAVCVATCDPVISDCMQDHLCAVGTETFVCLPAFSELGGHGDACGYLNDCAPGLFCANADRVAGCVDDVACCAEFCDVTLEDPDAQCPGAARGEECIAWDPDAPIPGYEYVGACVLPE